MRANVFGTATADKAPGVRHRVLNTDFGRDALNRIMQIEEAVNMFHILFRQCALMFSVRTLF